MSRMDGSVKGGRISARNSRVKSLERYYANPNVCKNCHHVIEVSDDERVADVRKKTFCSSSCAAQYNNKGTVRNPRKMKLCKQCGGEFFGNTVHCDKCVPARVWNKKPLEECKTDRSVRRIILEERGHRCESCGNDE